MFHLYGDPIVSYPDICVSYFFRKDVVEFGLLNYMSHLVSITHKTLINYVDTFTFNNVLCTEINFSKSFQDFFINLELVFVRGNRTENLYPQWLKTSFKEFSESYSELILFFNQLRITS